jgi:hypothetical protein
MGAQASVTVAPGSKTAANNNPNRLRVTGTNTVDHKQLTCWLSRTYLCTAKGAADGGVEAGPDARAIEAGPDARAEAGSHTPAVCGTSFTGNACTASEAATFVSQCATAGGTSKSVQSAANGSIGTVHCDCSCPSQ